VKKHPAHGPKWEARYGHGNGRAEPKKLARRQDAPPPSEDAPPPSGDTGAEAAAAARAAANADAGDDAKKVDDTDYQEADASENPIQPLPAPHVCTGPGAVAGDPLCEGTGAAADPANTPVLPGTAGMETTEGTNPTDARCAEEAFKRTQPALCGGEVPVAADPIAVAEAAATDAIPAQTASADAPAAATADATSSPEAACESTMEGVSNEWCITNCAIDNCPSSMCKCQSDEDEEDDPNKPVCVSIAPNVSDDWCQDNCERWVQHEEGFFNCPPSQCKCEEHPGEGEEHDAVQRMGYFKADDHHDQASPQ